MKKKEFDAHYSLKASLICALLAIIAAAPWALSASSTASSFIFPRFILTQDWSTGIAMVNPSSEEAVALVTLTNATGGVIVTSTLKIPPLGQVAKTAAEIFPHSQTLDGSLLISSSTPGLIAYYQGYDNRGTYMDGGSASPAGTELVFPVIPEPSEGAVALDLSNPNSAPALIELKLWGLAGNLLGKTSVRIPAGGFYSNLIEDLFPAETNFAGASHITTLSKPINLFSQAQSTAGVSTFAGFTSVATPDGNVDLAALNARPLDDASTLGFIPYFRTGSQYASTLALANAEATDIDVTVSAVSNRGTILGAKRIVLNAMGGYRAPLQGVIPSLASGEREGWLLLQSSGRLLGSLLYGRADAPALSALPFQTTPGEAFVFPHLVQGKGGYTEISITNPNTTLCEVAVYVIGANGKTLAANRISLAAAGRFAQRLDQLMPEISVQSGGYIYVSAPYPLFASASIWTGDGKIASSLVPQPISREFLPAPLESFAVTGKVKVDAQPAPGFKVNLSGAISKSAVSTADGTYAFAGLPAGIYMLTIEPREFQFAPAQTYFEITTESYRQDFEASTAIAIE